MKSAPRTLRAALLGSVIVYMVGGGAFAGRAVVAHEVRLALIVGEARYIGLGVEPLDTPANDALVIQDAFHKNGFDAVARIDLTHDDFRRELADFATRAAKADVVVFYFAGHGVQYREKNYLIPIDLTSRKPEDLPSRAISLDEVLGSVSGARKAKFVILDACRDAASDSATAKADAAAGRAVSGLADASGLAQINGAPGLLVYFSQQHGKLANDSVDGSANSPFAAALRKALLGPATGVFELFARVAGAVSQTTNHEQLPETATSSIAILSPSDEIRWGSARAPVPASTPTRTAYVNTGIHPGPIRTGKHTDPPKPIDSKSLIIENIPAQ